MHITCNNFTNSLDYYAINYQEIINQEQYQIKKSLQKKTNNNYLLHQSSTIKDKNQNITTQH
jgi:hypothetical protein